MEYFIPSDIARLVLGYLKDNSYHKTFHCFLKECCHLQELYNLVKTGREPRRISQLNLIVILEEWGRLKFQNENAADAGSPTSTSSVDTADETIVSDNDVTRKTTKKSPKRNKKTTVVAKKVKTICVKSPKSPKDNNVCVLSPRKLRSGKSVKSDATSLDILSPTRSSVKSATAETPEKSHIGKPAAVKKTNTLPKHKHSLTEDPLVPSPSKHVHFSGTNKTNSELKLCGDNTSEELSSCKTSSVDNPVSVDRLQVVNKDIDLTEDRGDGGSKVLHQPDLHLNTNIGKNNSGISNVNTTENILKHDALPPSESVGIADKCVSWINSNVGNETDPATACPDTGATHRDTDDGQVTSTECSSTESKTKTNDTEDTNKNNPDFMTPEPVPILKTPKKTSPSIYHKSGELITPVKLLLASNEHVSRSPRRKKPKTPKKRHTEVSPVSMISNLSVDPMFEKILSDHRLHQKLAETCNSFVQNQIKSNSGREKSSTERVSPAPTHISIDQETIGASKSLEEILDIDNNFYSEFLHENVDMSDPAYESLFKLFGTDRETFSVNLRREKEKELAQMEAEVEELERSNHEILCANFGMSHGDTSYDTDGINSPHHHGIGSQDLFSSQQSGSSQIPVHATSTPCIEGVPVNFTPLLRSHELGSSPVRSSSGNFGGVSTDRRASPGSTATQPFSPGYSHGELSQPATPSTYMNPATPQPSSPHGSHLVHSTPTGPDSVRSQRHHFHQSSPIHPTSSTVPGGKLTNHCSPLVKADLHPGSPRMVQRNAALSQGKQVVQTVTDTNNKLYFNSTENPMSTQSNQLSNVAAPGFMKLLTSQESSSLASSKPFSTIGNTIGCISLPQSAPTIQQTSPEKQKTEKTNGKERKKKGTEKSLFSTLKGLLSTPLTHPNSVPLNLTAGQLHEALKKQGDTSLTFHSPNGKSSFKVPLLDCQTDPTTLGLLMSGTESDADQTVHVYNESLDLSAQYSIAPENQATHELVNAIKAGRSTDELHKIQSKKPASNTTSRKRKTVKKSKKPSDTKTDEIGDSGCDKSDDTVMSGSTPTVTQGDLDPNQAVYTATPLNALNKATTVRALNFGDDQSGYRTIFPKMPPASLAPSVLILKTNQIISPIVSGGVNPPQTAVDNLIKTPLIVNSTNPGVQKPAPVPEDTPQIRNTRRSTRKGTEIQSQKTKPLSDSTNKKSPSEEKKVEKDQGDSSTPDTPKKSQTDNDKHTSSVELKVTPENSKTDLHKNDHNKDGSSSKRSTKSNKNHEASNKKHETSNKKHETSKKKLKVKIPVHKSPRDKKQDSDDGKGSIPFYFKPKTEVKATTAKAPAKKSTKKSAGKVKSHTTRKRKSVPIVIESESSDGDDWENLPSLPATPDKHAPSGLATPDKHSACERNDDTEPPSKDVLLEKIGLTPRKNVNEMEQMFKSPNRTNALDVLAEWQSSPLNSRKRNATPRSRGRFSRAEVDRSPMKAPSTPKRTPAKQLFTSPCKESSHVRTRHGSKSELNSPARRVNAIIDRLKRNNPDTRIPSPITADSETELIGNVELDEEFIDPQVKSRSKAKASKSSKQKNKKTNSNRNGTKRSKKEKQKEIMYEDSTDVDNVTEQPDATTREISVQSEYVTNKIENSNSQTMDDAESNDTVNYLANDNLTKIVDNLNSAVDNMTPVGDTENSQDAHELDQAVASIACDQSERSVFTYMNTLNHESQNDNSNDFENTEYSQTYTHVNNASEPVIECSSREHVDDSSNTIITLAEIHSHPAVVEHNSDNINPSEDVHVDTDHTGSDDDHSEILANDGKCSTVDIETGINRVDQPSCSAEISDLTAQSCSVSENISNIMDSTEKSKRREKKRKHKHRRHKHRRSHDGENTTPIEGAVGDLFVSPRDNSEHKHRHHHKKKKRSHKRHREEGEDRHDSKRRKKEKSKLSLDGLAALDVEQALTQIYSQENNG